MTVNVAFTLQELNELRKVVLETWMTSSTDSMLESVSEKWVDRLGEEISKFKKPSRK